MPEFQIELTVQATDQTQLAAKLQAFHLMNQSMEHEDLVVTAEFIAENPEAVLRIKQLIQDPPVWAN
jgi:hypothetical protein